MEKVTIREYRLPDFAEWVRMRSLLWPAIAEEEAEEDARRWLARADAVVLVAERAEETGLRGFVELGERAYADGCDTEPVGYLEGWFVERDQRGRGVGRALIEAALQWARQRGYREMASDALLENVDSQHAHEAVGFEEVERAVRYRKSLQDR